MKMPDKRFDTRPFSGTRVREHSRRTPSGKITRIREHLRNVMKNDWDVEVVKVEMKDIGFNKKQINVFLEPGAAEDMWFSYESDIYLAVQREYSAPDAIVSVWEPGIADEGVQFTYIVEE
jgi:hypothetical protein